MYGGDDDDDDGGKVGSLCEGHNKKGRFMGMNYERILVSGWDTSHIKTKSSFSNAIYWNGMESGSGIPLIFFLGGTWNLFRYVYTVFVAWPGHGECREEKSFIAVGLLLCWREVILYILSSFVSK